MEDDMGSSAKFWDKIAKRYSKQPISNEAALPKKNQHYSRLSPTQKSAYTFKWANFTYHSCIINNFIKKYEQNVRI